MTTIKFFPSLRNYTGHISISRNKKKSNIADFLSEWRADDDADDYFDLSKSNNYYRLNYSLITYLLINHQELFLNNFTKNELLNYLKDNMFYFKNSKIKEYEEYIEENDINKYIFFSEQLKNIQKLYKTILIKIPTCNSILTIHRDSKSRKKVEKIVLYRGFNYQRYEKILQDINIDSIITTETFLSTSIQKVVAIKFAYNYDDHNDINKHIVWKIIIEEDMFKIFNYTFISDEFNIEDDLLTLYLNSNIECEFILNMGAVLKCIAINACDFEGYYDLQYYEIPKKRYTEYTFKFMGWNNEYIDRVNNSINKCISYLK